ncbi:locomotion-related protein Hikaru genki isoform X2 [Danaus plexippus]|uniref:locomotion-related protein Hikaru genki isoform X2 n=1 Tax=Danaus plexippus TaxID=13037 RepID=UPI0013C4292E|nr:locomotion-related protein Hikaru genki isoform X2 [Danaus plexippus]
MNKYLLFLLFVSVSFCENNETIHQEFKCSLPEVETIDGNLDISRFRSDFSKISEVKFPGLIGPLNERLICKIKCIDGNWVGPLCSSTPSKQNGRFKPILRECLYRMKDPLLAISYKNGSILTDTYFPHGSAIVVRCKHFGLYKLTGENILRCENGEWEPKWPICVPTSMITNYTGGAPPTIQYLAASGSAIVELSGELYTYPGTTLWLDCLWPRSQGKPDWSWRDNYRHQASWVSATGEVELHYRLVLTRMTHHHSGRYTCTAPTGTTNTVLVRVVNVVCPLMNVSSPRLRESAQGSQLGNAVHFSCEPGYHLNGSAVVYCMGDGRWSSEPPTCVETFCPNPPPGPQLSVVEYNSSYGGRVVFACSWGYRLRGPPGLECEQDGKWSGEIPHCVPIYCPDPLVPENGRLLSTMSKDGKYPVGDLIMYACEDGLEIVGESSIVCTENGFWSHPPPFCLPPSEIKKADTIYIDNTTLVNFEE